jgi:hypothetical protein
VSSSAFKQVRRSELLPYSYYSQPTERWSPLQNTNTAESTALSLYLKPPTAISILASYQNEDSMTARELEEEYLRTGLDAFQPYYDKLVIEHPKSVGSTISSKERKMASFRSSVYVYGEIRFDSFAVALHKVRVYGGMKEPGGVFYDLGSGIGKPVFAAALIHDFSKAVGIEMLPGLNKIGLELLDRWKNEVVSGAMHWKENRELKEFKKRKRDINIELHCADVLKHDWTDATVVFANSTCFNADFMAKIAEKAMLLKTGTFFITFTKALPNEDGFWFIHEAKTYQMSWGPATVYIQEKVR